MTPLELSVCLHYYSSLEDMDWVISSGAPIVDETMRGLTRIGLLTGPYNEGQRFRKTAKLSGFVAMLMQTPMPLEGWIDPRTFKSVTITCEAP